LLHHNGQETPQKKKKKKGPIGYLLLFSHPCFLEEEITTCCNNYLDHIAMVTIIHLFSLFVILTYLNISYVASSEISAAKPNLIKCHDPAYGGNPAARKVADKKFVMVGGNGFGVGNFLVFFPAAYYFAALTGRVSFTKIQFVNILLNII
jgi:hypothetical protein